VLTEIVHTVCPLVPSIVPLTTIEPDELHDAGLLGAAWNVLSTW